MTKFDKTKIDAINTLKNFCAKCSNVEDHMCKISGLIQEIQELNGIPVIVNEQLRHVVFN